MIDILFIHIGKHTSREVSLLIQPMGLFALANWVEQFGFKSCIINYSLEKILNPNFSLTETIKKLSPGVLAFSLHWHPQSFSVIENIKTIKKFTPEVIIVIGGFTATYFAKELMEGFSEIDFLIRGDAELPLGLLLGELKKAKKDFSKIPNLVWREDNKIILNSFTYKIDLTQAEKLCFTNLSIMPQYSLYLRTLWNSPLKLHPKFLKNRESVFFYNPGRGCRVNCSFCGGGSFAEQLLARRKEPVFFPVKTVVKEFKQLAKQGVERVYISFDPIPLSTSYYLELFKELAPLKLPLKLTYECWGLPGEEFIKTASYTFSEVTLILSPECAGESLRKFNKGYFYSNNELRDTLKIMDKWKVRSELYFTLGLPGETSFEREKTLQFYKKFTETKCSAVYLLPIELEPASPMFLNPGRFKINKKRHKFVDFYKAHQDEKEKLGYSSMYQSEEEILSAFHRQFWFKLEKQEGKN